MNKNQLHGGLDATGIGATACARHGFIVPGSVVDFQKGERQMNMDYSICESLKNMNLNGLKDVLSLYDIMCQYWIKFADRVKRNPCLELDKDIKIIPGIGLFHVHGHQPSCLVRYAPTFIQGAGQVDGEIMEPIWSVLNPSAKSYMTASSNTRIEGLDDQMQYSNWRKLLKICTYNIIPAPSKKP